ncbi:MAG: alanine/glycine:cation symporter family protein [Ornithinimicrobium sp.]|uniref:alanine/glycine:cation symporter family protein n=1 Tax=Ornithinimicrobium sp. TaxID=1977084 RepID=UPI0026E036EE|nr:alanine/glycine:cation symporter family protein [Ornithinimicrobium sp.]MDO5738961.1 alanine/glycine:cation symporter family protein [Ornithinimicrobium sp.]
MLGTQLWLKAAEEQQTTSRDPEWITNLEKVVDDNFASVTEISGDVIFFKLPIPGFEMPFVVLWLIVAAIFITFYLFFIQVRGIPVAIDVIKGKYSSKDDPGEIPHYQALTSALSGTVGLGNIAGVGAAVTMGGPGATFWMILAGLFGMATKFAECTLGVKYRELREDGTVAGGPFTYLPVAFARFPKFLSVGLTGLFAVAILFFGVGGGNMFQSNQTYSQLVTVIDPDGTGFITSTSGKLVAGVVIAVLVGAVIIGGMKSIGRVTSTLVPLMGGIYVLACLVVIFGNFAQIPSAFGSILSGAFTGEGVLGGIVGVLIVGMTRAAFSNEAGLGSAPIAHSTVKTRRPVSEGFVALFEPFIDTVVICTMTALTITIANTSFYQGERAKYLGADGDYSVGGVTVTSDAFGQHISWFPAVLAIAVALFAISTLITWSYYGQRAWNYLFGDTRTATLIYRVVFLFFTVMGCLLTFGQVLAFADNFLFVCAFVNLLGVYMLLPVIKREMNEYLEDRKSGRLLQLGLEDSEKEISVEELAGENQLVDSSGRNRVASGVAAQDLRMGEGGQVRREGVAADWDDEDDDGFGVGAATTPYPPPQRGGHRGLGDEDDDGFGRGGTTTPYGREPGHQPPGRHESGRDVPRMDDDDGPRG